MRDFLKGRAYYGWYITATLAITETVSWGIIYYAFTVFMTPMEAELGWSRGQLTGGFSMMLLVSGAMAFPVGAWVDKHGARWLMTIGSLCATGLVIAWSQVTDVTAFYLIWIGLGICGAAVLYEPAFVVMTAWFARRRSTAMAIITFAAGLASTIFVPLSDALLNAYGWRQAIFILGVILGVMTIVPHALVLRRRPDDLGLSLDGLILNDGEARPEIRGLPLSAAIHSRFFWMLTLAFSLSFLAFSAIRVHFIPLLIDTGISATTAAAASGAIGLMQVVGRVIFAPLDARISGRTMIIGILSIQVIAMILLFMGSSFVVIGLFIILFGSAVGAQTLARPSIVADLFGSKNYGRISSIMAIFLTIAGTSAPVGAGLLYDQFGDYTPVLWAVLILAILATAVMIFSKPDRKVEFR